jgi:hypothetical protein
MLVAGDRNPGICRRRLAIVLRHDGLSPSCFLCGTACRHVLPLETNRWRDGAID